MFYRCVKNAIHQAAYERQLDESRDASHI